MCYSCYKAKFVGEEAEMLEFGQIVCEAKKINARNSNQFTEFESLKDWHKESIAPPFGLLKSDMIDRKLNRFSVSKAGDGNVRVGDVVFDEQCLNSKEEKIVRSFKITLLSGGLKDQLSITFLPYLEPNIHSSKPPEEAPKGGVVFHFKKQQATWHVEGKKISQLLPLAGTNDKLHFVITSSKKVSFTDNSDLFIPERYFDCIIDF